MSRWQRYWFDDGGRHGLAIVRIAIALAVLMLLSRVREAPHLYPAPEHYHAIGPWQIFGDNPPPMAVIDALWIVAWVGTGAMLVGLVTRIAVAASCVATVALAALSFSGAGAWSHQHNVVVVALVAMLGARCGDTLSLDALIRRLRGLPPIDVPRGYQWSLRLVQLAVALMFVGAFFHKWMAGHFTLRWALSDNLRHQLMVRFDLAGLERPVVADWVMQDVWRYRGAALLNMIAQLAPLFAIVLVRRPWVRAAAGALFVVEVLALGYVVDLWNLHWLPLAAVFVDWDRLIAWSARALGKTPPIVPPAPPASRLPRAVHAFVIGFVIIDVATSFVPSLDRRLNTFPFSSFPMFASVRAAPPYDEHRPYALPGDHFTGTADIPIAPDQQQWFDHAWRGLHRVRDAGELEKQLRVILATGQSRFGGINLRGLRHHLALFEAPAYPAPPRFTMKPIAITGEILTDGRFATVLGRWQGTTVELRPHNVDTANARLVYVANDRPEEQPLAATRNGDTFTLAAPLTADPVYIIAAIGETRWLVASKRSWRW